MTKMFTTHPTHIRNSNIKLSCYSYKFIIMIPTPNIYSTRNNGVQLNYQHKKKKKLKTKFDINLLKFKIKIYISINLFYLNF